MRRFVVISVLLILIMVSCRQADQAAPQADAPTTAVTLAKEIVVFVPTQSVDQTTAADMGEGGVDSAESRPEQVEGSHPETPEQVEGITTAVANPTPTPQPPTAAKPPINQYFDTVLKTMMAREPEAATAYALADVYQLPSNSQLNNESPAYRAESYQILTDLLDGLRQYDAAQLSADEQVSQAILEWYLDDIVRREPFAYHDYVISPFFGAHASIYRHLLSEHPLDDLAGAEAYTQRLQQFDVKFAQLIESAEFAHDQGIIPPLSGVRNVRGQLNWMMSSGYPELADHLINALGEIDNLTAAQRSELIEAAQTAVDEVAIPALREIDAFMAKVEADADDRVGAWKHPDGDVYYAAALRHHTTTDLTADEIHQIGLDEVARISAEIESRFNQLGYPDDTLSNNIRRVEQDGGTLSLVGDAARNAVLAEYAHLIDEAESAVVDYFDLLPEAELTVAFDSGGGTFYLPPATDGSRPGTFFLGTFEQEHARYRMPTLAYHEGIPGHHFQIALQQELDDLPRFRNVFNFTSYAEGWALYAEYLAAEVGLYEDDIYGDIGRLQWELFRAARLVVDTGIHAKQWGRQEAADYMTVTTGFPRGMVQSEVDRYIAWPGQATAYKIGQLKILELRDRAETELGDGFDLREFHNVILQNGAMPLTVLEQVVDAYIEDGG